jgi:hypothetical protein
MAKIKRESIAASPYFNSMSPQDSMDLPIVDNPYKAVTGRIEGEQVDLYNKAIRNYGDFSFNTFNPEAVLDKTQSLTDTWLNGSAQFGARTASSFLGTVGGFLTGATQFLGAGALRGGEFKASDFTMDYFSQGLDSFDKFIAEQMPIYQDPEEADQPWTSQLGSADFWAGNVLPNLGFTVGAALGTYATAGMGAFGLEGKLLQAAGRSIKATETGMKLANAGKKFTSALGKFSKGSLSTERALGELGTLTNPRIAKATIEGTETALKGQSSIGKKLYGTMMSTVGESKFEAIGTYNEMKQELLDKGYDEATADEYAKKAANVDFLLNTAVLGISNFVQFGHLFGTGKTLKGSVSSFINGNMTEGFTAKNLNTALGNLVAKYPKMAIPAKIGLYGGTAIAGGIREGAEEWAQYMGNKVSRNYSDRVLKGYNGGFGSSLAAFGEAASDEFRNPENYNFQGEAGENFFLGALMGALGMPVNLKGDFAGGIVGAIQEETQNKKLVAEKNARVQETVKDLNNIRTKYGVDELVKNLPEDARTEAADIFKLIRDNKGTNKAFNDAMISASFQLDASDAYSVGDVATAKIMEAMGLAHDVITAAEAGRGNEFLDLLEAQGEVTAADVRGYLKQNTSKGQVDPLADLTDDQIVEKVRKNKEALLKKVKTINDIHAQSIRIPGLSKENAKIITTNLSAVADIEDRFAELLSEGGDVKKLLARIRPKDPEKAAAFDELTNEFLNPENIKQSLANVTNSKEFVDFYADVMEKTSGLVESGVIDLQSAVDVIKSLNDLGRTAKNRSKILKQYNKIIQDPANFEEWSEEEKEKDNVVRDLSEKVGEKIADMYNSAGIIVPENILEIEEGNLFGRMGDQTVSIRKKKGERKYEIRIAGELVNVEDFFARAKLVGFTPLSEKNYAEFVAAKREQKAREDKRTLVIKKIKGEVEKFTKTLNEAKAEVDTVQKERQKHLDKLNELDPILQEAKKELTALYKSKNSKNFKRSNTIILKALLKELNVEIDYINNELSKIDTSIQKLQEKETELQEKTQMLETELAMLVFGDYTLEERVAELIEAAKDPGIQQQIEALMAEKDSLIRKRNNFIAIQEKLKDLFDKAENETQLERYLTRIEEIDEILNVLDEQLASLNSELSDLQKIAFNPELMERASRLQAVIDKIIDDNKYTQREDEKPVGAEPIEETEIKVKFTDSAAKPITIGFFTTASSQTDTKDVDREDPRTVRWFKYINETPLKELKDNHRLLVFNKNSGIDEAKLGEELFDSESDFIDNYVMITDKDGNPILDNGLYVWSPLHKPDRDKSKFSYPKKEDGSSFTEEEEQEMYNQARKKYIEFVNKVSTEKVLLPITNRSVGINKYKTGNTILAATGEDVKSLPLVVATSTKDRVVSVELVQQTVPNVPVGTVVTETERGDYLVVNQNNLSQQDAEATYELIKRIVDGETKIDGKDLRSILENIIFVGKTSSPYSFFFYPNKDGEGKGGITMGGKSVAKDLMESQKEEIITFLKKKRYNVNKASLEKAQKSLNSNKPEPFFMPKLTEAGLDFEKYESYKHFLVDSSVRSLDSMPLTVYAPNLGEIGNKNKYLTFAEQQEKPKKKGKAKEELVTLQTVSIGEILGTEEEVPTEVAPQDKIDNTQVVQNRLSEDLGVTSKIIIDSHLNGLHYIQTEDGKYYVIPDSSSESNFETAKEVTKEQILKPFRTVEEWKKVGSATASTTASLKSTPTKNADKEIAEYRAAEEEEVKKIIPNIEDYKVDGVINKDKVLEGIEKRKREEIYNTVRKPVITELELSDEVDGSLISEHNTKEEVEAAYLETVKVNAAKEEAIQAKYKAEADAYNEIYDRYDKLITETAKGTIASNKKAGKIVEAKFAQQETEFYIEVEGENKDFLLTWNRNSNKPSLWGDKQPDGTYKSTLEYPSEKDVQALIDKYVPKNLLTLINKWTNASKLPVGEVLDAQYKIAREIEAELATIKSTTEAPVTDLEKIQEQYYKDRKVSGYSKLNHATPEEFLKHLKTTAKGTDGKAKLAQVALEELQKLETKEELPSLEGVQALEDILPSVTVSEADRAEAIAGFDNFFGEPAGVSTTTLAEAEEAKEKCK